MVRDTRSDFSVGFGSTNALAGQAGLVPLVLDSDADLVELDFELAAPDPHLLSLELTSPGPEVLFASLDPVGPGLYRLQFNLDPSRLQSGSTVSTAASGNGEG